MFVIDGIKIVSPTRTRNYMKQRVRERKIVINARRWHDTHQRPSQGTFFALPCPQGRASCRAYRMILCLEAKQTISWKLKKEKWKFGSVCFIRTSLRFHHYFTDNSWQFLVLHWDFTVFHETWLVFWIMFEVNWNMAKYPWSADEV
jgi:hypothetical protein